MIELLPISIIAGLLFLNAVFVAAEFAIIGTSRAAIERRAADGHASARRVEGILREPVQQDRFIATAQVGITFASLGLGMYGEHYLAERFSHALEGIAWLPPAVAAHTIAIVLAVAVLTYFHIVLGEMVPKSLALLHAERTVLLIVAPMLAIQTMLKPLVVALNGLGTLALGALGVRREISSGHFYTTGELQYLVEESEAGGLMRAEAGQVMRDLFSFGERTAEEIMVPRVRVRGLPLGATPEELAATAHDDRHSRYPVYEVSLDDIIGLVHIKDVLRLLRSGSALAADDVRPTAFVSAQSGLNEVLEAMRRTHTQLVVVMDEHGGTDGIVTVEDLCEEAVGDVEEATDTPPDIDRDDDGALIVDGTVRLDELGEVLGRSLDDDEIDSVSGLVLAHLNRPPVLGDAIVWRGLAIEVIAVSGHGVARARVTDVAPEAAGEDDGGESDADQTGGDIGVPRRDA